MPDHTDYTVGWICAVEYELVAAQALLDEEHNALEHIPVNDNNNYTLGRLGKHNVVIAVMSHWQYGHVSAANAARDMVRSFPNVRIGLMVGIGAGAPSARHDIRLGDVVVCSPGYENGGVFQYDYGKTVQDESFTTTGYLNQPPQFMLTAISTLKATYKIHGHNFNSTIQATLEKRQRLQLDYCRPDPATDKLYSSEWKHAGGSEDCCEAVCGSDNLKIRPERSDLEDSPKIHYGLIASANQLMQNAIIRDKLSAEKDVLCFEMEAAGLMNHFPCLIIRGICDYADTHKNLQWQGYAAMTAATYAKDLLSRIAPNKIEAERRLGEVFSDVQGEVRKIKTEVESIKANAHLDRIRKWLSPPDPSTNYNNALRLRHPGSGQWLLDQAAYSDWKLKKKSFLWLHGIPGCGKTILSSTIIEDLSSGDDTGKQRLETMLRSLIGQLYDKIQSARDHLDSLYSSCNREMRQLNLESLEAAFMNMVEEVKACSTRTEYPTGGLLSWIQSLQKSQANTHLIITSRPEQDIEASIKAWARDQDIIPIQNDLVQEDIDAYVRARVREHGTLSKRWCSRSDIQCLIESALKENPNGMFRWAACQLDELAECLGPPEVQEALSKLPKTLDETYARIIAKLPSQYLPIAIRLLQFLTYSKHPLSLEEAIDCIAVDMKTKRFDLKDRIPVPREISRYCSSLVVIAERAGSWGERETITEIRLSHYSVKEYLTSNRLDGYLSKDFQEMTAREVIASVCLIYLLGLGPDKPDKHLYPMGEYAARHWAGHAIAANNSKSLLKLMTDFFACQKSFEAYRIRGTALYQASKQSNDNIVQMLLDNGADINAQGEYGNALQASSEKGRESIVQILLNNGADVNAQGGFYGNALQAASIKGYENIVQTLLNNGANVNAQGGQYGNALRAASAGGYRSIVQALLNNGANINSQGGAYGNALQAASKEGHESIVQILLNNGADINAQEGIYGNALQAASKEGHKSIVQILLNNGADVNAQGGFYGNALQAASIRRRENIVQTLLSNGANVNAQGGEYGNALQAASIKGHESIVQALLINGADINAQGGAYGNALQAASAGGHESITQSKRPSTQHKSTMKLRKRARILALTALWNLVSRYGMNGQEGK
ncbi:hypothetical protein F4679DRAFT_571458 [Xylaria curta]|nr:hypothetical protein F4679DRAFT_571458 [Xylaria curta]